MAHVPSVGRILRRDQPASGMLFMLGAWWVAMAGAWLIGSAGKPLTDGDLLLIGIFAAMSAALTLACAAVAAWRVRMIRGVFARGVVVEGRFAGVEPNAEDVPFAVVAYRYGGEEYRVRYAILGAPDRTKLTAGSVVQVLVDPVKPSRALVASFFT